MGEEESAAHTHTEVARERERERASQLSQARVTLSHYPVSADSVCTPEAL